MDSRIVIATVATLGLLAGAAFGPAIIEGIDDVVDTSVLSSSGGMGIDGAHITLHTGELFGNHTYALGSYALELSSAPPFDSDE